MKSPFGFAAALLCAHLLHAQSISIGTSGGEVANAQPRVEGTSSGIERAMWYEVRRDGPGGAVIDHGAFAGAEKWFFQIRRLQAGRNHLTVFAVDAQEKIHRASITLLVPVDAKSPLDPRPRPAELWWGGIANNEELVAPGANWEFTKKYADGYFFHTVYWRGERIAEVGRPLSQALAPYAPKYAVEMGGQQWSVYDERSTAEHYGLWGAERGLLRALHEQGNFPVAEVTHDWGLDYEKAAVHVLDKVNPAADELEIMRYNTRVFWGEQYFQRNFARYPNIKGAQTTSLAWRWYGDFPPCWFDESSFATTTRYNEGIYLPLHRNRSWLERDKPTPGREPYRRADGSTVDLRFNLRDALSVFIDYFATQPLHSTFAFYNDYPYAHMILGGKDSVRGVRAREMLRAVERDLHARGALHTFVCNDLVPGDSPDLLKSHRDYANNSLAAMHLHQLEGGRADRYLFESWYFTRITGPDGKKQQINFPHWVGDETREFSYTWTAKQAIRFLKGIRDLDGRPETLRLDSSASPETGGVSITLTNTGASPCLPAITLDSVANAGAKFGRWRDASGRDITHDLVRPDGWTPANILQPGDTLALTVDSTPAKVVLKAFWNPQDPTAIVRDRIIW